MAAGWCVYSANGVLSDTVTMAITMILSIMKKAYQYIEMYSMAIMKKKKYYPSYLIFSIQ